MIISNVNDNVNIITCLSIINLYQEKETFLQEFLEKEIFPHYNMWSDIFRWFKSSSTQSERVKS